MISFIASVIDTLVCSSSRLKKLAICSKMMTSASWLAMTLCAACMGFVSDHYERGRSRTIVTERRTPAPAKMTFAGENT